MATKAELIETANEIAGELGIEIDTDGMTNADLSDLVKDLKAKKTDADTQTQADEPVKTTGNMVVADGMSITSKRGILSAGQSVGPKDFKNGDDAIQSLLKRGALIVKK